jgi:hypothetical protein
MEGFPERHGRSDFHGWPHGWGLKILCRCGKKTLVSRWFPVVYAMVSRRAHPFNFTLNLYIALCRWLFSPV